MDRYTADARANTSSAILATVALLAVAACGAGSDNTGTTGNTDTGTTGNTDTGTTGNDSAINPTGAPCTLRFAQKKITADTRLSESCYKVASSITVLEPATLTLDPGVRLEFSAGTGLTVEAGGALLAKGSEDAPIVLTGGRSTPGYWDGLVLFESKSTTNEFDHVLIEYGGGGSDVGAANLRSYDSRLKIRHTTLRRSATHGLVLDDRTRLDEFAENAITENEGSPVRIHANSVGSLDASTTYSGNGDADHISVYGANVVSEQRWRNLDVPYKLGGLDIKATLAIDPGSTLVFGPDAVFGIESTGTLIAKGSADQPITFTADQPTPGYWHGVQFSFSSNANELDHVVIEYGGGASGNGRGALTVFGADGRLKIANSIVRKSSRFGFDFGRRIRLDMANVTVTANAEGAGVVYPNDVGQLDVDSNYRGNTLDRIAWESGDLSDSQTIPNLGVPYHVGHHGIEGDLSIAPGTVLVFAARGGFEVERQGSLTAKGSAADPIVFTGVKKISGYWGGIQFFSGSLGNILDHAILEYGGKPNTGNTEGLVGVYFSDARVDVTNSILRHSETNGIWRIDSTSGIETGNVYEDIRGLDQYAHE